MDIGTRRLTKDVSVATSKSVPSSTSLQGVGDIMEEPIRSGKPGEQKDGFGLGIFLTYLVGSRFVLKYS